MASSRTQVGCCVVLSVLITIIVLITTSFANIDPNEVGIEMNPNFQKIDETKLYTPARHFLGPGHYFIVYPTTAERIEETIQARTHDGMRISLKITFNFKLMTTGTELIAMYLKFGDYTALMNLYRRISRDSIRMVTADYEAFDFFPKRAEIQEKMTTKLMKDIEPWSAKIENFQLQELILPAQFEEARARQVAAREEEQKANYERDNAQISANSLVQQAEQKAQVILYNAGAQAKSITLAAGADQQSQTAKVEVETEAYTNVNSALKFTPAELLSYVWVDAMSDKAASGTLLAAQTPKIIKDYAL